MHRQIFTLHNATDNMINDDDDDDSYDDDDNDWYFNLTLRSSI